MNVLKFRDVILTISNNIATFSDKLTKNNQKPYLQFFIKASENSSFIENIRIRYRYFDSEIKFIAKFDKARSLRCLGNNTELLNNIYSNLNFDDILNLIKNFNFNFDEDINLNTKYTYAYSGFLAIIIFILYLSFQNVSENFFEPFNLRRLIFDDDLDSICQGINNANLNYLRPISISSLNILNNSVTSPIIYILSLLYNWIPFFVNSDELDILNTQGKFDAVSGIVSVLPDIIQDIHNIKNVSISEIKSSLDTFLNRRVDFERRLSTIADNNKTELQEILDRGNNQISTNVNELVTLKNALIDRLRQELAKILQELKESQYELSKKSLDLAQNVSNNISDQQNNCINIITSTTEESVQRLQTFIEEYQISLSNLKTNYIDFAQKFQNIDQYVNDKKKELDNYKNQTIQSISNNLETLFQKLKNDYQNEINRINSNVNINNVNHNDYTNHKRSRLTIRNNNLQDERLRKLEERLHNLETMIQLKK